MFVVLVLITLVFLFCLVCVYYTIFIYRCQPLLVGIPYRTRTGVAAVKGRCPRPLDERDIVATCTGLEPVTSSVTG